MRTFQSPLRAPLRRMHTHLRAVVLAVAAAACLVLVPSANAGMITATTFSPSSLNAGDPSVVWTIGFTPTTSISATNAVAISFPVDFGSSTPSATLGTGFVGCGVPTTTSTISGGERYFFIVLPGGCSLAGGVAASLTLTGVVADANSYGNTNFTVGTYAGASTASAIDATGGHPSSGFTFTTPPPTYTLTYSTATSAGTATSGGAAPVDASSPYVMSSMVSVLGNTGVLTLTGYAFDGWCNTSNAADPTQCTGTHFDATDTFPIAANTTLYSQWIPTYAADGTGTTSASPESVTAGSTTNTVTFTYTAASGGTNNGQVEIDVPTGWSAPTLAAAAGCTTASTGTLAINGRTIQVSGLTLAAGATLTVTYGATAGGTCTAATKAVAPSSAVTSAFTTRAKSTPGGVLTALAASPTVKSVVVEALKASFGFNQVSHPNAYVKNGTTLVYGPTPSSDVRPTIVTAMEIAGGVGPYTVTYPFASAQKQYSQSGIFLAPWTTTDFKGSTDPVTVTDSAGTTVSLPSTVEYDRSAPTGVLSVTYDAKNSTTTLELGRGQTLDDVSSWSLYRDVSAPSPQVGACAELASDGTLPKGTVRDRLANGSRTGHEVLLKGLSYLIKENRCVGWGVEFTDRVGNSSRIIAPASNTAFVKQSLASLKAVLDGVNLGSGSSSNAFTSSFTVAVSGSVQGLAANRVNLVAGSTATTNARAALPKFSFFTLQAKRIGKSKYMRVRFAMTKQARAYLAKYPRMQGRAYKFSAPVKVTLKTRRTMVVNTTFKLKLPKLKRVAKR